MKIETNRPSAGSSSASRCRYFLFVFGFLALCALLLSVPTAFAQTADTGSLVGTVTDSSGAAIPDAAIKVINEATGDSRDLVSQSNGNYQASLLLPGTYRIEVSKEIGRAHV